MTPDVDLHVTCWLCLIDASLRTAAKIKVVTFVGVARGGAVG